MSPAEKIILTVLAFWLVVGAMTYAHLALSRNRRPRHRTRPAPRRQGRGTSAGRGCVVSAEMLRDVAAEMREQHNGRRVTSDPRWLPVADLLDALANRAEEIADSIGSDRVADSVVRGTVTGYTQAIAVAAYWTAGAAS